MLELRVAALLVFASYLFSIDAYILMRCGINVLSIFGYQTASTSSPFEVSNLLAVFWATGCLGVAIQSWLFSSLNTRVGGILTLSVVLFMILKQHRLGRILKRVIRGGISAEHRLGDILVSDALVSLAPVLSDIVLSLFLTIERIPASQPIDRVGLMNPLIPLMASVPSLIRIKQCFYEYRTTRNKQHLLNLLKYMIGNAVNAIRVQIAVLNKYHAPKSQISPYEQRIPYVLVISATYSLIWDILVDWKMGRLLDSQSRSKLRLPLVSYYCAIGIDIVLRFAFLAAMPYEHVVFALQALELTRRGMWIVFRSESEPQELTDIEMHSL